MQPGNTRTYAYAVSVPASATLGVPLTGSVTSTYAYDTNLANDAAAITITPADLDLTKSSYTVSGADIAADNQATGTITATLVNTLGGPMAGFDSALAGTLATADSTTTISAFTETAPGTYTATIKSSSAGNKVVKVTAGTSALKALGNDTAHFVGGTFSWSKSTFAVTPAAVAANDSTWIEVSTGAKYYTGTLTARDANGSPLTGLDLTDITFSSNSADVTQTSVTAGPNGTYTVRFSSTVAAATTTASVQYQGAPVPSGTGTTNADRVKPIPFKAGAPDPNPTCGGGKTGTTLTATTPIVLGGTSAVAAYITDSFCNPLPGVDVTFGKTEDTADVSATLSAAQKTTGTDGYARVTLGDTQAEGVAVTASIRIGSTATQIHGSPARVVFTADQVISWTNSSFTVSPAATADPATWVAVSPGDKTYTATLVARDSANGPMGGMTASQVQFGTTNATSVVVAGFTETTPGTYQVTYSSMVPQAGSQASVAVKGSPAPTTKPIPFTSGGLSFTRSTFAVTPVVSAADDTAWPVADGTASYTGLLTAMDAQGKLLPGLTLTDIVFTASGANVTVTSVAETAAGVYAVKYTTTVADPAYTATVTYQGTTVGTAKPVPFKVGAAKGGEFTCTTPVARPGTHLEAVPTTLAVGDPSTATALVTDANCNPVAGAPVAFTVNPTTAQVTPAAAVTGTDGKAVTQVNSPVAGKVTVAATTGSASVGTEDITFVTGRVSAKNSTFVVTPAANLADEATWQSVGSGSYTGTLTARDDKNQPLADLAVATIVFTPSVSWITRSAVANKGGGVYTVTFTATTAGPATATVVADGTAVGTAQPVPFHAGAPDPNPGQCEAGKAKTGLTMNPVAVPVGSSSQAVAYVTDAYCNPVKGAVVTFTLVARSQALLTGSPSATGADGKAYAQVSDGKAETVTVHAAVTTGPFPRDAQVTFGGGGKPPAPVVTGPRTGAIIGTGKPEVTGTGEPGGTINVTDKGGETLCTATVKPDGTWSCMVNKPLPEGPNEIDVTQTSPGGGTSEPTVVKPVVDTQAPPAPVVTAPKTGESIKNPQPEVTGTGEPGATVNVVDKGGETLCTVTVKPDGSWSCKVNKPLPEGPNEITVTQVDPAGNTSKPTVVTPEVDTTAPAKPVVNPSTGGSVTGTGEPDGKVTITIDGKPVPGCENTTTDADGTFTCRPTTPIPPGTKVEVTVTDPAGNVSPPATIVIGKPTAPTGGRGESFPYGLLFMGSTMVTAGLWLTLRGYRPRKARA
jgi:hypothetical protein